MAFCTKCGNEVKEEDAFCGKCGVARLTGAPRAAGTPTPVVVEGALERDAKIRLKREHDKLVVALGLGGGFLTLLLGFLLASLAGALGTVPGSAPLAILALAATALFVFS